MTRLRLVLGNLAVLLALLLLCATAGEILVRLAPTRNDRVERDGEVKYRFNPYRADGRLGWSHRPDWETVHETGNFRVTVRTDDRGLRRTRSPQAANGAGSAHASAAYRILVLGDSFAFGWGVEDDETFAALLEDRLAPPPGAGRVEVLNAGVAGWSADHYALFLKEPGLALDPDLVLVVPSENDLSDLAAARLTLSDQGLPVRTASALRMIDRNGRMRYVNEGPYALPSFTFPGQAWLAEHSALYHWLRYRLARVWVGWSRNRIEESRKAQAGEPPEGPIGTLSADEIARGLWTGRWFQLRYHQYLLEDLARTAAARGVPVRTLLVTRKAETEPEGSVLRALRDACLEDALCVTSEQLLAGEAPADVFFPDDGHWTAQGHQVIADGLREFLGPLPVD
jgi:lysophospholipase L1-like esterase